MTSAFQATVDASRSFLTWWGAELAELVPPPLRRWTAREARRTVFSAENGHFVRYEESRGKIVRHGEVDLQAGRVGQNGWPFAGHRLIGVRLPRSACLIRRLELPAAARRDFNKILQLDLERATPFRHQAVYIDHFTEDGPGRDGKIAVRQVVVKREVLDPIVQQLAARAIKVDIADCWDDADRQGLPINLLSGGQGARGRDRLRLPLILCVCVLVLTCS